MIVKGLDYNAYYINNPIWVDVSELNSSVVLGIIIQGSTYNFDLAVNNRFARFDLASIINGLIPSINNKNDIQLIGGKWFIDGAYTARVTMTYGSGSNNFGVPLYDKTLTFVKGGVNEYKSNVPVSNNLSISKAKWDGFPKYNFKLVGNRITGSELSIVDRLSDDKRLKRLDCNNAYLLFRNRLGGFDGYLFEDFNIEEKSKSLGYYITDKNIIDSGTELTNTINLRTKLIRKDYELARHLIDSEEVYLYDNNKLIRLTGQNNLDINDKNNVQDFEISFNIPTNYKQGW